MASSVSRPPPVLSFPRVKPIPSKLSPNRPTGPSLKVPHFTSKPPSSSLAFQSIPPLVSTTARASSTGSVVSIEEIDALPSFQRRPVKFALLVFFWASLSLAWFAASGDANAAAAANSIRASSFGLKIARKLRSSGWPDEAVVLALATLPIIELRGAIPVGYWLQLKPAFLTLLSVLGNMIPVPFIILYLKKFATFLAGSSRPASRLLDLLLEKAKEKARPVEEFQWLGLMLFVAVPFPGTGAWTGAIIASILDMPFWCAFTANFCGIVLAGLLVNLLMNLGLKYAIVTGIILFTISTFMWSILRNLKNSLNSSN